MHPMQLLLDQTVDRGTLTLVDAGGRAFTAGDGGEPRVTLRLTDRAAAWWLVLRPELALGELYAHGRLVVEDGTLEDLLRVVMGQGATARGQVACLAPLWLHRVTGWLRARNPLPRAAQNAHHHYDLGNDFYRAWLDPEMQYSCAFFAAPDDDIAKAQRQKMDRIAAKLRLGPEHHVLDIGCGWGGLAMRLAARHGCRVTGLTLAREQAALARERVVAAGLDDRVEIRLEDYRRIDGPFDRIVSVGMFEHVGPPDYGAYFDAVARLLAPDGVALIHSIGRAHGPMPTNPWLAKHIFPGGYIPALSEVMPAVEQARLWTTDLEILRLHYARTLEAWRERFAAVADRIADARLQRLWLFYLTSSALFFRQQDGMVFQLQLTRDRAAVPVVRDYLLQPPSERRMSVAAELTA